MNKKIVALILIGLIIYAWSIEYKLIISRELKVDFDEPIYLKAGIDLGSCIYSLNFTCLVSYRYNYEHPMLGKIIYGLIVVSSGSSEDKLLIARTINVILSSLTTFILALINPLASILHAGDSLYVKYSTEVYLDGLAVLFTLLSYFFFSLRGSSWVRKTILSSVFAGLAVATKYTAIPALLAIPAYMLLTSIFNVEIRERKIVIELRFKRGNILMLLVWVALGFTVFIAVNPMFWGDLGKPLDETMLYKSLTYHNAYMERISREHPLPFYQQLVWMWENSPLKWHPGIILFSTSSYIVLLGYLGLPLLLRRKPLYGLWLIIYTVFLFSWGVKWPQYTTLLSPVLAFSSALLIESILRLSIRLFKLLGSSTILPLSIIAILLLSFVATLYIPSVEASYYSTISIGEKIGVYHDKVVMKTNDLTLVLSRKGLRPVVVEVDDYDFIEKTMRGPVYATPYEWIPRNRVHWPGEIYSSYFDVLKRGNHIIGVTRLAKDAPGLILYKEIWFVNSTCFTVKYTLYNPSDKPVKITSNPNWNVNWGFSIELTISPKDIDNYYQFYVTRGSKSVITRINWYSLDIDYVKEYGLINNLTGASIVIINYNASLASSLWFEYGDKWISIRLSYKPITLKPHEKIVYYTIWCVKPPQKKPIMGAQYIGLTSSYIVFIYLAILVTCIIYVLVGGRKWLL